MGMKKLTLMVMVLCFSKGLALNDCNPCECCKNGASGCYYNNYYNMHNYCLDGCIDGYYGARCAHSCINNCRTCSNHHSCTKCRDGYYGIYCHQCPSTCLICSGVNNCEDCKDGYYNDYSYQYDKWCQFPCLASCKSCNSYNNCTICKDGFYNGKQYHDSAGAYYDCRFKCRDNCKSCTSYDVCNECQNGFYNNKMTRDCSLTCRPECKSCTSYNECSECKDSYYLSNKLCYYCNSNCSTCSSYQTCTTCIAGRYNDQYTDCRESCRPECKSCSSYNSCTGCIQGRYGKSCENNCGRGCVNSRCNAMTGYCTCKTGFDYHKKCGKCLYSYYGTECDIPCSKGCHYNNCDDSGKCICKVGFVGDKCDKCDVGKYGDMCENACPDGCEDSKCSSDGICYSCKPGMYGSKCTGVCPEGCRSASCSDNGKCYNCIEGFTGAECDRCVDGLFGTKCDQKCPDSCTVCSSVTNCSVCVDKHWGNTCQKCSTHCQNCYMDGACSSCDIGFYGLGCNEQCNRNCLDGKCDQFTGNCSKGCIKGYYGTTCDLKCSPNCEGTVCSRQHGECLKGCKTGFNGTTCSQALEFEKEVGKDINVTVGVSAGCVLLVLVVIAIIIIMKRRRRNGQRENKDMNENIQENETVTYSVINDTNIAIGNNYTESSCPDRESMAHNNNINDELSAVTNENIDALYAKPIKPKKNIQGTESTSGSSTDVLVNDPNYEKSGKARDKTENKATANKHRIDSNPVQMDDINTSRKSVTRRDGCMSRLYDENDAALEIEEDIERLYSKVKSVILEENARRAAEAPDLADTYYNVGAVKKRKIKLDQLSNYVAKMAKRDFADEFQTLPAMLIKPYAVSQKRTNLSKNRYKGIYPYDDTRVVLKDCDSDYINASYIDGYNKNKAYIASIGPTTKYMGDMSAFWIMVWQENVGKIVMLTKLTEGGVPKCDQYWPGKGLSLTFANIQVTCQTEEEYADYTFRSFLVQKGSVKRNIFQVHFTAWPDKGTPDDVTSLVEFREKVNNTRTDLNGPILVHCSAGIGRTGTYIALDSVSKEGEAEGEVDIYAFVRNMREQRVNMIQTAEQYQYLHNAVVHTLTFDSKAVQASKFSEYMKSHSKEHLGKMFEKLQASAERRSDDEKEAVKRNKGRINKNRDGADIPGDQNRPKVKMYLPGTSGHSDYINALYLNSFKSVNRYLVAQTPLPETVEDFLTLIIQEKVSCIISMADYSSDQDVGFYFPADNHTLRKGAFIVHTERGKGTDKYSVREMKISRISKSGSEEVTIPHVEYTKWDKDKLAPEDPAEFVQFIRDMELKFGGNDTKRPILVHCSTGAKRSGLFCVVSTLLEKIQIDQEVSIVNTVRQIRCRRHMAIPNKEQYIFCHLCVNEYLRTFETYSNFELKT